MFSHAADAPFVDAQARPPKQEGFAIVSAFNVERGSSPRISPSH